MSYNPIKSDDPKAIEKLNEKIKLLKENHEIMKNRNAYYRKHKTMRGCEGISDEEAEKIDNKILSSYSWDNQPYPSWQIQNSNQEIKRLEKRRDELVKSKELGYVGWEFEGGEAVINNEQNRLQLFFDEKPTDEQRATLKANGFKWSPTNMAWQRMLNDNSFYVARRIDFIQPKNNQDIVAMQPKASNKDDLTR